MSATWRAFPRIPRLLVPGNEERGDDLVVPRSEEAAWWSEPVVVEEKLDGANVAVWVEDGQPQVATRGGVGAQDRAGQLGPLRAWAWRRLVELRSLLRPGETLYGEWLWLVHTVRYASLPDHLVSLDLRRPDGAFLGVDERDARLAEAGLVPPPVLVRHDRVTPERLQGLLGVSRWGAEPAEGLVLRRELAGLLTHRCKILRPDFQRFSDAEFGQRGHNDLVLANAD